MLFSIGTTSASNTLNSDQLKELLVGYFLKVNYIYSGDEIHIWEFCQSDGTITGSSEFGPYSATYEIRDNKVCPDYADGYEAYEGCYQYQHVSGDQYQLISITRPETASELDVTIVKGMHKSLNNN